MAKTANFKLYNGTSWEEMVFPPATHSHSEYAPSTALAEYLKSSTASTLYQAIDSDLTAIAGLTGTKGLLKKTGDGLWSLDTNTYLTSHQSLANYSTLANTIKSLSISGKTITYTKGDGNTGTLTTQDTTYSNATTSAAGLMSAADKTHLNTLVGLLTNSKTTVDTIAEVLKVFEDYPEGTNLANALSGKLDKAGGEISGNLSVTGDINASTIAAFSVSALGIDSMGSIKEEGSYLYEKYLGKTAQATDSAKLGGVDAASYATQTWVNNKGYVTTNVVKISLSSDNGTISSSDLAILNARPHHVVFERGGMYYFAENLSGSTTWYYSCNVYYDGNKITKRVIAINKTRGDYSKTDYTYSPDFSGLLTTSAASAAYLGINATAKDSEKLGGTAASSYVLTSDSRLSNSRPASDVYSWAKASTKPSYAWSEITSKPTTFTPASHTHDYLPLSGGTLSGTLTLPVNTPQIQFRDGHSSYDAVISYGTDGNEAMVFSTKNAVTSFMFVNGEDTVKNVNGGRWTALTPGLQIKNNCVSIGKLIANGVTPTYKLNVDGSLNATTIYENGKAIATQNWVSAQGYAPQYSPSFTGLYLDDSVIYTDGYEFFFPTGGGGSYTIATQDWASGAFLGKTAKATSATVADSANAVAWGNISGKPNSYYTLPTASSSTLGGVKTTSTVTSNSGYTACPIISGVPYYKDTNTTYTFTNKAATLAWNTTSTIATVGGVDITVKLPANPDTNTTYSNATTSAAGLMSAADKTKLDGIATGANNYTYTLPTRLAESSTGGYNSANEAVIQGWHYMAATGTQRPPFKQVDGQTGNDYRIMTTAYSSSWLQQIATDFRSNDIFTRRCQNGTWQDWTALVKMQPGLTSPAGTNNSIARWDNSRNATIKDSKVTIDDNGNLSTTGTINSYTLGSACAKSYTDSSSASAISTGTSLVTERDVYYGLPTINGSHSYTSSTTIYAPTSAGSKDQVLVSNGSGSPYWKSLSTTGGSSGAVTKLWSGQAMLGDICNHLYTSGGMRFVIFAYHNDYDLYSTMFVQEYNRGEYVAYGVANNWGDGGCFVDATLGSQEDWDSSTFDIDACEVYAIYMFSN